MNKQETYNGPLCQDHYEEGHILSHPITTPKFKPFLHSDWNLKLKMLPSIAAQFEFAHSWNLLDGTSH